MTALLMTLAVLLDRLLAEPRRWHPLAGFGRLAAWLEQRIYAPDRWRGVFAVALLLLPSTWLAAELVDKLAGLPGLWGGVLSPAFSLLVLYFALGQKCLHDHVRGSVARHAETPGIATAACETVLENGNHDVFAALFWFLVAGAPGAVLYRLAHALNALWREPHHREFGWAAAQLDDILNIVPARLTALTYAVLGHTRQALDCWREQAPAWDDPNTGPLLAAGAGALGITLGGRALRHGEWHERPLLGTGDAPEVADIERALALVRHGVLLWLLVTALGTAAWGWLDLSQRDWLAAALEGLAP